MSPLEVATKLLGAAAGQRRDYHAVSGAGVTALQRHHARGLAGTSQTASRTGRSHNLPISI